MRRFARSEDGTALVETLLVLPILLALIVGSFQLGSILAFRHTADKSVRAATRYLARLPEASFTVAPKWGLTEAQNLALTGTRSAGGNLLLPGWSDPTSIAFTPGTYNGTPTVRLRAEVPVQIPVLRAFGFENAITLSVAHEERHIGG